MKKAAMYFAAVLMAASLGACSPTQIDEEPAAAPSNPAGLTPEMMETRETVEKTGDPNAPVYDMAFIYYPDGSKLIRETVDVEEMNEVMLVGVLIDYGVLEEGTEALSMVVEGGEKAGPGVSAEDAGSGERTGTLDLSQFDGAGDPQKVSALANTFIENYELDKLAVLVNGENFGGGDAEGWLYFDDDYENVK